MSATLDLTLKRLRLIVSPSRYTPVKKRQAVGLIQAAEITWAKSYCRAEHATNRRVEISALLRVLSVLCAKWVMIPLLKRV